MYAAGDATNPDELMERPYCIVTVGQVVASATSIPIQRKIQSATVFLSGGV
jgi:hypothetical protein